MRSDFECSVFRTLVLAILSTWIGTEEVLSHDSAAVSRVTKQYNGSDPETTSIACTTDFFKRPTKTYERCVKAVTTHLPVIFHCPCDHYFDSQLGECTAVPGGGDVVHVDYQGQCKDNYTGILAHPTQKQFYYICKDYAVIIVKCSHLKIYDPGLERCVQVEARCSITVHDESDGEVEPPACKGPGRYAVPENLSYFYTCTDDGEKFYRSIFKCPLGTQFDPIIQSCTEVIEASTPRSVCLGWKEESVPCPPCMKVGRFRNEWNCSTYYVCTAGKGDTLHQHRFCCPIGNFFCTESLMCKPAAEVDCHSGCEYEKETAEAATHQIKGFKKKDSFLRNTTALDINKNEKNHSMTIESNKGFSATLDILSTIYGMNYDNEAGIETKPFNNIKHNTSDNLNSQKVSLPRMKDDAEGSSAKPDIVSTISSINNDNEAGNYTTPFENITFNTSDNPNSQEVSLPRIKDDAESSSAIPDIVSTISSINNDNEAGNGTTIFKNITHNTSDNTNKKEDSIPRIKDGAESSSEMPDILSTISGMNYDKRAGNDTSPFNNLIYNTSDNLNSQENSLPRMKDDAESSSAIPEIVSTISSIKNDNEAGNYTTPFENITFNTSNKPNSQEVSLPRIKDDAESSSAIPDIVSTISSINNDNEAGNYTTPFENITFNTSNKPNSQEVSLPRIKDDAESSSAIPDIVSTISSINNDNEAGNYTTPFENITFNTSNKPNSQEVSLPRIKDDAESSSAIPDIVSTISSMNNDNEAGNGTTIFKNITHNTSDNTNNIEDSIPRIKDETENSSEMPDILSTISGMNYDKRAGNDTSPFNNLTHNTSDNPNKKEVSVSRIKDEAESSSEIPDIVSTISSINNDNEAGNYTTPFENITLNTSDNPNSQEVSLPRIKDDAESSSAIPDIVSTISSMNNDNEAGNGTTIFKNIMHNTSENTNKKEDSIPRIKDEAESSSKMPDIVSTISGMNYDKRAGNDTSPFNNLTHNTSDNLNSQEVSLPRMKDDAESSSAIPDIVSTISSINNDNEAGNYTTPFENITFNTSDNPNSQEVSLPSLKDDAESSSEIPDILSTISGMNYGKRTGDDTSPFNNLTHNTSDNLNSQEVSLPRIKDDAESSSAIPDIVSTISSMNNDNEAGNGTTIFKNIMHNTSENTNKKEDSIPRIKDEAESSSEMPDIVSTISGMNYDKRAGNDTSPFNNLRHNTSNNPNKKEVSVSRIKDEAESSSEIPDIVSTISSINNDNEAGNYTTPFENITLNTSDNPNSQEVSLPRIKDDAESSSAIPDIVSTISSMNNDNEAGNGTTIFKNIMHNTSENTNKKEDSIPRIKDEAESSSEMPDIVSTISGMNYDKRAGNYTTPFENITFNTSDNPNSQEVSLPSLKDDAESSSEIPDILSTISGMNYGKRTGDDTSPFNNLTHNTSDNLNSQEVSLPRIKDDAEISSAIPDIVSTISSMNNDNEAGNGTTIFKNIMHNTSENTNKKEDSIPRIKDEAESSSEMPDIVSTISGMNYGKRTGDDTSPFNNLTHNTSDNLNSQEVFLPRMKDDAESSSAIPDIVSTISSMNNDNEAGNGTTIFKNIMHNTSENTNKKEDSIPRIKDEAESSSEMPDIVSTISGMNYDKRAGNDTSPFNNLTHNTSDNLNSQEVSLPRMKDDAESSSAIPDIVSTISSINNDNEAGNYTTPFENITFNTSDNPNSQEVSLPSLKDDAESSSEIPDILSTISGMNYGKRTGDDTSPFNNLTHNTSDNLNSQEVSLPRIKDDAESSSAIPDIVSTISSMNNDNEAGNGTTIFKNIMHNTSENTNKKEDSIPRIKDEAESSSEMPDIVSTISGMNYGKRTGDDTSPFNNLTHNTSDNLNSQEVFLPRMKDDAESSSAIPDIVSTISSINNDNEAGNYTTPFENITLNTSDNPNSQEVSLPRIKDDAESSSAIPDIVSTISSMNNDNEAGNGTTIFKNITHNTSDNINNKEDSIPRIKDEVESSSEMPDILSTISGMNYDKRAGNDTSPFNNLIHNTSDNPNKKEVSVSRIKDEAESSSEIPEIVSTISSINNGNEAGNYTRPFENITFNTSDNPNSQEVSLPRIKDDAESSSAIPDIVSTISSINNDNEAGNYTTPFENITFNTSDNPNSQEVSLPSLEDDAESSSEIPDILSTISGMNYGKRTGDDTSPFNNLTHNTSDNLNSQEVFLPRMKDDAESSSAIPDIVSTISSINNDNEAGNYTTPFENITLNTSDNPNSQEVSLPRIKDDAESSSAIPDIVSTISSMNNDNEAGNGTTIFKNITHNTSDNTNNIEDSIPRIKDETENSSEMPDILSTISGMNYDKRAGNDTSPFNNLTHNTSDNPNKKEVSVSRIKDEAESSSEIPDIVSTISSINNDNEAGNYTTPFENITLNTSDNPNSQEVSLPRIKDDAESSSAIPDIVSTISSMNNDNEAGNGTTIFKNIMHNTSENTNKKEDSIPRIKDEAESSSKMPDIVSTISGMNYDKRAGNDTSPFNNLTHNTSDNLNSQEVSLPRMKDDAESSSAIPDIVSTISSINNDNEAGNYTTPFENITFNTSDNPNSQEVSLPSLKDDAESSSEIPDILSTISGMNYGKRTGDDTSPFNNLTHNTSDNLNSQEVSLPRIKDDAESSSAIPDIVSTISSMNNDNEAGNGTTIFKNIMHNTSENTNKKEDSIPRIKDEAESSSEMPDIVSTISGMNYDKRAGNDTSPFNNLRHNTSNNPNKKEVSVSRIKDEAESSSEIPDIVSTISSINNDNEAGNYTTPFENITLNTSDNPNSQEVSLPRIKDDAESSSAIPDIVSTISSMNNDNEAGNGTTIFKNIMHNTSDNPNSQEVSLPRIKDDAESSSAIPDIVSTISSMNNDNEAGNGTTIFKNITHNTSDNTNNIEDSIPRIKDEVESSSEMPDILSTISGMNYDKRAGNDTSPFNNLIHNTSDNPNKKEVSVSRIKDEAESSSEIPEIVSTISSINNGNEAGNYTRPFENITFNTSDNPNSQEVSLPRIKDDAESSSAIPDIVSTISSMNNDNEAGNCTTIFKNIMHNTSENTNKKEDSIPRIKDEAESSSEMPDIVSTISGMNYDKRAGNDTSPFNNLTHNTSDNLNSQEVSLPRMKDDAESSSAIPDIVSTISSINNDTEAGNYTTPFENITFNTSDNPNSQEVSLPSLEDDAESSSEIPDILSTISGMNYGKRTGDDTSPFNNLTHNTSDNLNSQEVFLPRMKDDAESSSAIPDIVSTISSINNDNEAGNGTTIFKNITHNTSDNTNKKEDSIPRIKDEVESSSEMPDILSTISGMNYDKRAGNDTSPFNNLTHNTSDNLNSQEVSLPRMKDDAESSSAIPDILSTISSINNDNEAGNYTTLFENKTFNTSDNPNSQEVSLPRIKDEAESSSAIPDIVSTISSMNNDNEAGNGTTIFKNVTRDTSDNTNKKEDSIPRIKDEAESSSEMPDILSTISGMNNDNEAGNDTSSFNNLIHNTSDNLNSQEFSLPRMKDDAESSSAIPDIVSTISSINNDNEAGNYTTPFENITFNTSDNPNSQEVSLPSLKDDAESSSEIPDILSIISGMNYDKRTGDDTSPFNNLTHNTSDNLNSKEVFLPRMKDDAESSSAIPDIVSTISSMNNDNEAGNYTTPFKNLTHNTSDNLNSQEVSLPRMKDDAESSSAIPDIVSTISSINNDNEAGNGTTIFKNITHNTSDNTNKKEDSIPRIKDEVESSSEMPDILSTISGMNYDKRAGNDNSPFNNLIHNTSDNPNKKEVSVSRIKDEAECSSEIPEIVSTISSINNGNEAGNYTRPFENITFNTSDNPNSQEVSLPRIKDDAESSSAIPDIVSTISSINNDNEAGNGTTIFKNITHNTSDNTNKKEDSIPRIKDEAESSSEMPDILSTISGMNNDNEAGNDTSPFNNLIHNTSYNLNSQEFSLPRMKDDAESSSAIPDIVSTISSINNDNEAGNYTTPFENITFNTSDNPNSQEVSLPSLKDDAESSSEIPDILSIISGMNYDKRTGDDTSPFNNLTHNTSDNLNSKEVFLPRMKDDAESSSAIPDIVSTISSMNNDNEAGNYTTPFKNITHNASDNPNKKDDSIPRLQDEAESSSATPDLLSIISGLSYDNKVGNETAKLNNITLNTSDNTNKKEDSIPKIKDEAESSSEMPDILSTISGMKYDKRAGNDTSPFNNLTHNTSDNLNSQEFSLPRMKDDAESSSAIPDIVSTISSINNDNEAGNYTTPFENITFNTSDNPNSQVVSLPRIKDDAESSSAIPDIVSTISSMNNDNEAGNYTTPFKNITHNTSDNPNKKDDSIPRIQDEAESSSATPDLLSIISGLSYDNKVGNETAKLNNITLNTSDNTNKKEDSIPRIKDEAESSSEMPDILSTISGMNYEKRAGNDTSPLNNLTHNTSDNLNSQEVSLPRIKDDAESSSVIPDIVSTTSSMNNDNEADNHTTPFKNKTHNTSDNPNKKDDSIPRIQDEAESSSATPDLLSIISGLSYDDKVGNETALFNNITLNTSDNTNKKEYSIPRIKDEAESSSEMPDILSTIYGMNYDKRAGNDTSPFNNLTHNTSDILNSQQVSLPRIKDDAESSSEIPDILSTISGMNYDKRTSNDTSPFNNLSHNISDNPNSQEEVSLPRIKDDAESSSPIPDIVSTISSMNDDNEAGNGTTIFKNITHNTSDNTNKKEDSIPRIKDEAESSSEMPDILSTISGMNYDKRTGNDTSPFNNLSHNISDNPNSQEEVSLPRIKDDAESSSVIPDIVSTISSMNNDNEAGNGTTIFKNITHNASDNTNKKEDSIPIIKDEAESSSGMNYYDNGAGNETTYITSDNPNTMIQIQDTNKKILFQK